MKLEAFDVVVIVLLVVFGPITLFTIGRERGWRWVQRIERRRYLRRLAVQTSAKHRRPPDR